MRHLIVPLLAAAAASVLSTVRAQADLGDQLFKLLADDGGADDQFGISVAISGSMTIVGAYRDDDNGKNSGSAYLFDTNTGQQLFKLLPNDGAEGDHFGQAVAISGSTAIIGSRGDDDNGNLSGAAYLFDTTTGQQLFKLLAEDGAATDNFGWAVAISGTTAIVAADSDNDNDASSGSAYLFDTATGRQIFKLLPNDGSAFDEFGQSVAILGTTALVGAERDDDNGDNSGSAYLFDTTTGRQIAKLLPNDGAEGDEFGWSVAMNATTAIVSARYDDDNGVNSGSAYFFDISDPANPTQTAKVLPNDGTALDEFGRSIAISGTTLIVGTYRDDDNGSNSGSAYLFDTTTFKQIAKLLPNDGAAADEFGLSVAISGDTAIVGARWHDDNHSNSGSAYLFDAAAAPGECPWDLDGDGVVGVSDLLILVGNFGPCDGECPADFDDDGFVGVSDLLILIANFGECPGTGCPWDVNGDGVVDHRDLVEVVHNMGLCDDPDKCPWDVNGDGVVNGADVSEVATHFGPCP